MSNKKTGVELIAEERKEQTEKHGWSKDHDSTKHPNGELARAACAICYDGAEGETATLHAPEWAWEIREYKQKRCENERIERLKIAGALIAAEIDRLQNL